MDIKIRVAREEDRASIIELWATVFPNPAPHNDPNRDIDRKFGKDRHLFLVAESVDDGVIGTIMCGWDGHRGYVWYVGVSPTCERRGIGTRLMRHAEDLLFQQGCRKLNLMIRAGNEPVIHFYRTLGYETEDRVCMSKLLREPSPCVSQDLRKKAERFNELHHRDRAFVMPNPWDAGSTKMLSNLGFEALATTSAGFAISTGQRDGTPTRDAVLAHCRDIAGQTELPVSADLENGFARTVEDVLGTYRLACTTGLVGGSIEDASGDRDNPIFDHDVAVARVEAAVAAVREADFHFTLTARAENHLYGRPDLDDTIRRLLAFEKAGADVLYAPGLRNLDDIRAICSAVSKPVNVVISGGMKDFTVDALSKAGVRRISLGASYARVACGALLKVARQCLDEGHFEDVADAPGVGDIYPLLNP